jgi:V8-like Glu-specific endopeptidase
MNRGVRRLTALAVLMSAGAFLTVAAGGPPGRGPRTGRAASAPHSSRPAWRIAGITSPTVGALFTDPESADHGCTGSVVASPKGNVVLTAAHCVTDSISGARFVPAYHDGIAPFGTWIVQRSEVDDRWTEGGDPEGDVAFLTVTPAPGNRSAASVQSVVGANVLAEAPEPGDEIVVTGYGVDDARPVECETLTYRTGKWPSFDCDGFVTGTSGSPWIVDFDPDTGTGLVAGIIGGLEQGGSTEHTSYSPIFDEQVTALAHRAVDAS